MASVGDVAGTVRRVMAQLDQIRTSLRSAAEPMAAAGSVYADTGRGSNRADLAEAAALLRQAYTGCGQAVQALGAAHAALTRYLVVIGADQVGNGSPVTPHPVPAVDQEPTSSGPWRLSADQVAKLRRDLPEDVSRRGAGRKTHGRWVGPDGVVRSIISAVDELSRGADAWFRSHGIAPVVHTHCEVKVAYRLRLAAERRSGHYHASLIVNNTPCDDRLGCETLLPTVLPPGSTLTVYGPAGYRRTFTGRTPT